MSTQSLLTVLSFLAFFAVCECRKTNVTIVNDLGTDLTFHCKSKDNDLGSHFLSPNFAWYFDFERNVFDTTLFFCKFIWGNEEHWFDVVNQKQDHCGKFSFLCIYKIRVGGPCLLDELTRKNYQCYPWNPRKLNSKRGI
ncbi:hypothetical protein UlMin_010258 [Ulmus minor]